MKDPYGWIACLPYIEYRHKEWHTWQVNFTFGKFTYQWTIWW